MFEKSKFKIHIVGQTNIRNNRKHQLNEQKQRIRKKSNRKSQHVKDNRSIHNQY